MIIDRINPYVWIMQLRRMFYRRGIFRSYSVDIPVISVGNISLGGTGKTPHVLLIARMIEAKWNLKIAIILRGYKRESIAQVVASNGNGSIASLADSGDEAQLYARKLPKAIVICDGDRVSAAKKAVSMGAQIILLDDGFQHQRLQRDLNIVLINSLAPRSAVLPFGKSREPEPAINDADVVIITNSDSTTSRDLFFISTDREIIFSHTEIIEYRELASKIVHSPEIISNKRVLALSAIGMPQGFERSIIAKKVVPYRLPDHSKYDAAIISTAIATAKKQQCDCIVTTLKDAVKILPVISDKSEIPIFVAISRVVLSDESLIENRLEQIIQKYRILQ